MGIKVNFFINTTQSDCTLRGGAIHSKTMQAAYCLGGSIDLRYF